jgi:hypothetical protein
MATTLLQLRTRIRQRADQEHTGERFTDSEINDLINVKVKELYELLVLHSLHRTETDFTVSPTSTSPATLSYTLPADLFAVLAVYAKYQDDLAYRYLTRHDHRTYPDVNNPMDAETYRVRGSVIEFNPVPTSGTYVVRYVPVPGELATDTDTFDGILGWEEYVVIAVALCMMDKDEDDPATIAHLEGQLARLHGRIKQAARQMEISESPAIAKVRWSAFDDVLSPMPGAFNRRGYRGWW